VVLASSKEGLSFPQQQTWCEWAKSCGALGFAVYAEDHKSFEQQCSAEQWDFSRKFLCPVESSSAWGEFSLLHSELLVLKRARKTFDKAQWFYVVSGDSIPTKTPSRFVKGPSTGSSILGFDPELNADVGRPLKGQAPGGVTIFEHSQWKVLTAPHVLCLVDELIPKLPEWRQCVGILSRELCRCLLAVDEWVIGTMLRGRFQLDDWSDGVCIMEQNFVQKSCAKCKQTTGHAKVLGRGRELECWRQKAWEDESTFVLRKVLPATKNV
jgi:hypothetical protein